MSRIGRTLLIGLPLLLLLLVGLFLLLFPADAVRTEFEKRASAASGYDVTVGRLGLAWRGNGLGLALRDLRAESGDGGQTITIPDLKLRVALWPLLKRQVDVKAAEAVGLLLEMRPARRAPPPSVAPAGGGSAAGGGLAAPSIRVRDGRIVQSGPAGVTSLAGVRLDGSFAGSAGGGRLTGRLSSDSLRFAPAATPERPMTFPPLELTFESGIAVAPPSASTRLDGRLGPIPFTGTVESRGEKAGWGSRGTLELAPLDAEALKALASGAAAGTLRRYSLAGRLEGGRLTFQTFAGKDDMEYEFHGRLLGLQASLPDKGRVIDSGEADLVVRPDDLQLNGRFRSGQASLEISAWAVDFAAPRWNAHVDLTGPAAEALRFAPPQPGLEVSRGAIEAHIDLAGVVGEKSPPTTGGTVKLDGLALRHPAVAVPVDRLDLTATLNGQAVRLERGFVQAGRSDARFDGRIANLKKLAVELDVEAGTVDLDQLFPATPAPGPAPTAAAGKAAAAPPLSGRITIDSLVRERMTVTNVSARYAVTAAGMQLDDFTGYAYGGVVSGRLTLTPRGPKALDYSGDFAVRDMRAEQLLPAWTPIRGLEGTLSMDATLSGRNEPGINPLSVLNLLGSGLVLEGSLVNIPAVRKLSQALQFKEGAVDRLTFKTLRHRIRVADGLVQLDTLRISQPEADWQIGGRIGLDGRLDCPVRARLGIELFRPGSDLEKAARLVAGADGRIELGLRLGGTLTDPSVSVDLDPLLKAAEKKGMETLGEELKRRLKDLFRKP